MYRLGAGPSWSAPAGRIRPLPQRAGPTKSVHSSAARPTAACGRSAGSAVPSEPSGPVGATDHDGFATHRVEIAGTAGGCSSGGSRQHGGPAQCPSRRSCGCGGAIRDELPNSHAVCLLRSTSKPALGLCAPLRKPRSAPLLPSGRRDRSAEHDLADPSISCQRMKRWLLL